MNECIIAIACLGGIGLILAVILYFVSKKFAVEADSRIDEIAEILPKANCGGCGYPGCKGFAEACVKANSLVGKNCPVGGVPTMAKVAQILGLEASDVKPQIAVVRCQGDCTHRTRTNHYDGAKKCALASDIYGGETDCSYGCLGYGDCVEACLFDAISINPSTLLPIVDETRCTSCGACVKACPKQLIELRPKGPESRRIYVSCVNKDKGPVARKACNVACIGCGICVKKCSFDAIKVANHLAYIDPEKCTLCHECVEACPQHSIVALHFSNSTESC